MSLVCVRYVAWMRVMLVWFRFIGVVGKFVMVGKYLFL